MVIQFGVGIEGVDEQACTSRKILLCFILRAHGKRRLHRGDGRVPSPRGVSPRQPDGRLDPDRHSRRPLGQVYLGQQGAGRRVGQRRRKGGKAPQSLRCKLHTVWRGGGVPDPDHPAALAEPSGNYASVDAALENNPGFDAVVLACNQTAENVGMVDRRFIERVGNRCPVVNVARGGLFDRDAVLWGLETGTLCYLASDVAWSEPLDPNDPVAKHPNAYFTPHVGGVTESSYTRMGRVVAEAAMKAMVGGRFGDDVYQKNGW